MATAQVRSVRQVAFDARCIALAEEKHALHTARHIGETAAGAQIYQVPSRTSDAVYVVKVFPHIGESVCCCTASLYHRPCSHIGACLVAEKQRTERETGPGMSDWAWMNTECLGY